MRESVALIEHLPMSARSVSGAQRSGRVSTHTPSLVKLLPNCCQLKQELTFHLPTTFFPI